MNQSSPPRGARLASSDSSNATSNSASRDGIEKSDGRGEGALSAPSNHSFYRLP